VDGRTLTPAVLRMVLDIAMLNASLHPGSTVS
jgi:hypothetical protein